MGKYDEKIRFDFVSNINKSLEGQIKLADKKAAWVFSVLGVATGALITNITKINWAVVNSNAIMIFVGIAIILLLFSFKQVVRVIYPRISKGKKDSFIFFGSIVQEPKSSYIKKGNSLTIEEIRKELYGQAHVLASITERKFKALRMAIVSASIAIVYILVLIVLI